MEIAIITALFLIGIIIFCLFITIITYRLRLKDKDKWMLDLQKQVEIWRNACLHYDDPSLKKGTWEKKDEAVKEEPTPPKKPINRPIDPRIM